MNLDNIENQSAISRLRISSHKLATTIGKWYKNDDMKICKHCNENTIENKFQFLFSCESYTELRKDTLKSIKETDNIDLEKGNRIQNLQHFSYTVL